MLLEKLDFKMNFLYLKDLEHHAAALSEEYTRGPRWSCKGMSPF
jgi:hypothetical protein